MTRVRKKLTTRKIVVAGLLGGIAMMLGATGLGFIPVPSPVGRATILHVPVILAAILEGPLVGAFTGFLFGIYSFITPTGVVPADPIVRILPRILIGVTSYYAYWIFRKNLTLASISAAIVGTLTNTIGFLGLAVVMNYLPIQAAYIIIISNSIFEVIIASIITVILVKALKKHRNF